MKRLAAILAAFCLASSAFAQSPTAQLGYGPGPAPSGGSGVAVSGDITCNSSGVCTVNSIQGTTITGTTGTGANVLATGATVSGITIQAGSTISDAIMKTSAVSTSTLSKTSSTAFTQVPNLTVLLAANGFYLCQGHLGGTAAVAGGIAVDFQNVDTLTVTSMSLTATNWNGAVTNAKSTVTALATAAGTSAAAYTDMDIQAGINVSAGGTLGVFIAQNTSNATATTVLLNSYISCTRTN